MPVLDQRGHGESAHTYRCSVEEMRKEPFPFPFADALALGQVVLGGHCPGGTVAELCAGRYPGRPAGLFVADRPPCGGSGAWNPGSSPDGDLPA